MDIEKLIRNFWKDVAEQSENALANYFKENATVCWHNTNEKFTVSEFIRANCEYPGNWDGEVERIEQLNDLVITVTRVWLKDNSGTFRVTSFFTFEHGKIKSLDEYWGDVGSAPQWRLDKQIGTSILEENL